MADKLIPDPKRPGKHIDPATGIWPMREWGISCQRGFISNSRFGGGQVIERTNRQMTRKWRRGAGGQMLEAPNVRS